MPGRPLYAVALPAGPALLDLLGAALDGGPAVLPIDPALPAPARHRLLAELRPHTLVTDRGSVRLPGDEPAGDGVSVVIATSGSTGSPKGVELAASALKYSAAATLRRVDARAGERWLCCLPPSAVGGLQVLIRSLLGGTEPVVLDGFSAEQVAAAPAQHLAVVPTQLRRLLDADVDLARFRTILVGGDALPSDLLARAAAAGAPVVTTYGMTETSGGCVYDGRPLDGVEIDVIDDGRVRIGGPVLARGYRLRPDLTEAALADGWLTTQDLGRVTGDGRLEVLGRVDDVIVTGGVNVSATAIGELLATQADVAAAAVVGVADEEWGQRVVAVVVPKTEASPPNLAVLRAHVYARAAPALAPRELHLVDALPMLASGKLDRPALRQLALRQLALRQQAIPQQATT